MKKYRLDAQEIKNHNQPEEFYSYEQGPLKRKSSKWAEAGLCPFHNDSVAGSFYIHLETGAYKCWSCHASGGDQITFLMNKYDISFKSAIELLASRGGYK